MSQEFLSNLSEERFSNLNILFLYVQIEGGRLFEFEADGANLGIAIASILALLKNMSTQTMGIIFLIYAV